MTTRTGPNLKHSSVLTQTDPESVLLKAPLSPPCGFRKAIAKSGLQHMGTQSTVSTSGTSDQPQEPSSSVDWTVSSLVFLPTRLSPITNLIGRCIGPVNIALNNTVAKVVFRPFYATATRRIDKISVSTVHINQYFTYCTEI